MFKVINKDILLCAFLTLNTFNTLISLFIDDLEQVLSSLYYLCVSLVINMITTSASTFSFTISAKIVTQILYFI